MRPSRWLTVAVAWSLAVSCVTPHPPNGGVEKTNEGPPVAARATVFVEPTPGELRALGDRALLEGRLATAAYYGRALQLRAGRGESPRNLSAILSGPAAPDDDLILPALRLLPTLRPLWTGPPETRNFTHAANTSFEGGLLKLGLTATPDALDALWSTPGALRVPLAVEELDTLDFVVDAFAHELRTIEHSTETPNPAYVEWNRIAEDKLAKAEAALATYRRRVAQDRGQVIEAKVEDVAAPAFDPETQRLYEASNTAARDYNDHLLRNEEPPALLVQSTRQVVEVRGERQLWTGALQRTVTSPADDTLRLVESGGTSFPRKRIVADPAHGVTASGETFLSLDDERRIVRENQDARFAAALVDLARQRTAHALKTYFDRVGRSWTPDARAEELRRWTDLFDGDLQPHASRSRDLAPLSPAKPAPEAP